MCVCVGAVDFPPNTILKLYNVFFANVLLTIELGNGRWTQEISRKDLTDKIVLLENIVKNKNLSHSLFSMRMNKRRNIQKNTIDRKVI